MLDTVNWYAVHTRPRQESRVSNNLSVLGIEVFLPYINKYERNSYTGEVTRIVRPFFPNYVFARFDIASLFHKVKFTRGVHSVVCCGATPAPVDGWIIDTIQSRVGEDGCVKLGENFKLGDEVIIEAGQLKNFKGIFEREMSGADRVMILLQTVSYQAHLIIEKEVLKKACGRSS
jgi:transcriptional antiterminator RfaH